MKQYLKNIHFNLRPYIFTSYFIISSLVCLTFPIKRKPYKFAEFTLVIFWILWHLIFVLFPIIFMYSIDLQEAVIFTKYDLPRDRAAFEHARLVGYRNFYVTLEDSKTKRDISLGVWHILPLELSIRSLSVRNFNYKRALKKSKFEVLLYFHGTGEARCNSLGKYEKLRQRFHVVTFDYRGYGDSANAPLSEENIVSDCVQLFVWLRNQTISKILVWGHSLGAALAARTLSILERMSIKAEALVLESGFSSLNEELYCHPLGKVFAWLPWFKATILEPLYRNGFRFETAKYVKNISCPILIIHSEDDNVVPIELGIRLFEEAKKRTVGDPDKVAFYMCPEEMGRDHSFIYQDPYFYYIIMEFLINSNATKYTI